MFEQSVVDDVIQDLRECVVPFMEFFNNITLKELNVLPFSEKAVDILDLCDLYPDVYETSPLIAYFVLARCHYLVDEVCSEIEIIGDALEAREKRGVTAKLDSGKILQYWKSNVKEKYPVDFKALQDTLSLETVASAIGELRRSIDYDNMPEDMQTVAKALFDELLTEPAEMQLLIVRGILCITVED